jgi:hypothetical protein
MTVQIQPTQIGAICANLAGMGAMCGGGMQRQNR